MATIRPFTARRYSDSAGALGDLVAPPYDVLSSDDRERFAAKNPHNVMWLTLPETCENDRSQFVKYARSASRFAEWSRNGTIVSDPEQAYYLYRQNFLNPVTNTPAVRTQIMVTLKLEPYENGVVLPHEQTFPKHKQDRLRLLEAVRAHLESIYGLYQDDGGRIARTISACDWKPIERVQTDDGIEHTVFRCGDPEANRAITESFADQKIWIADGHHRYETALNFRASAGAHESEIAEDFMMIGLSAMNDPGLALLATHRIVNRFPFDLSMAEAKLETLFNVRKQPNSMLPQIIAELANPDTRAFGVALPGGVGILATLDRPEDALKWIEGEGSDQLKLLDVTILHSVILEKLFEISGSERIEYTRDANEALKRVESSTDTAAFLMNPPSVAEMRKIAEGGEKMPQKSTFYYPKLLSGLLFWSLSDFKQP